MTITKWGGHQPSGKRAGGNIFGEQTDTEVWLVVPSRFASFGPEIQRAHSRFKAAGHDGFLARDMLLSLSPSRVETTLEEVRQAGLTGKGGEWALEGRTIQELAPSSPLRARGHRDHRSPDLAGCRVIFGSPGLGVEPEALRSEIGVLSRSWRSIDSAIFQPPSGQGRVRRGLLPSAASCHSGHGQSPRINPFGSRPSTVRAAGTVVPTNPAARPGVRARRTARRRGSWILPT
jgi:hypothetical protein